jgi:hypothetical protein
LDNVSHDVDQNSKEEEDSLAIRFDFENNGLIQVYGAACMYVVVPRPMYMRGTRGPGIKR